MTPTGFPRPCAPLRTRCLLLLSLAVTLSAAEQTASEEFYDLRGPMPGPGDVIHLRGMLVMEEGSIIGRFLGKTFGGRATMRTDRRIRVEYLEENEKGPTSIQIKFTRDRSNMALADHQGRILKMNHTSHGVLHGKTILLKEVDSTWVAQVLEDTAKVKLAFPWADLLVGTPGAIFYPEEPVAPGYKWKVDTDKFLNVSAGLGSHGSSGEVEMQFEGVEEVEGEACAVIKVSKTEFEKEIEYSNGGKSTVKLVLEGKMYRSLRTGLDINTSLKGKMSMTLSVTGRTFDSDILIEGPVKYVSSSTMQ